jgi:isopenicillin N synthase-like dioxygenase
MGSIHNIPLINISAYLDATTTEGAKAKVIKDVQSACSSYGFLQIEGHGVPIELQRRMLQSCKTLFNLAQSQKDALSLKNNPQRR